MPYKVFDSNEIQSPGHTKELLSERIEAALNMLERGGWSLVRVLDTDRPGHHLFVFYREKRDHE